MEESSECQETKTNEAKKRNGCSNGRATRKQGSKQESKEVARAQNKSEQDSRIRKCQKKVLGTKRRETEPRMHLKSD